MRLTSNIATVSTVLLSLLASDGRADAVAYTCVHVGSDRVRVTTDHGACTGFEVRNKAGKVTKRAGFGFRASGVLLSSPDARSVVLLQTSPYASLSKEGTISGLGTGGKDDPLAVVLYRDGRRKGKYRFSELLVRQRMVTLSTSHVQWLRDSEGLDAPLGPTLTLKTTSLRDIVLDVKKGKLRVAENAPEWDSCDVIAYGKISASGGAYKMDPAYVAKGSTSKP